MTIFGHWMIQKEQREKKKDTEKEINGQLNLKKKRKRTTRKDESMSTKF